MRDVPPSSSTPDAAPWRVWLVTDVYPPGCGGSGWSTHALARVLTDHGHDVAVITIDQSRDDVTAREFEGIGVTSVGVRDARTVRNRLGALDFAHAAIASYLETRLRAEPDVDILHAQHLHTGPPTVEVGRAHARATLATVRDYWPVCLHGTSWWNSARCDGCTTSNLRGCMSEYWKWPAPLSRVMVGWARGRLHARATGLGRAHRVLTVSEAVRRRIEGALPEADVSVVPNIVDPDAVRAAASPDHGRGTAPYLLTAGKLQPTKGFDLLLSALHEIDFDMPLVVAGDGPSRSALEAQAAAMSATVEFLGWVDHSHLLGLQRDAHAVILPSAWDEPLSRLVLETMGLGTPVIAWARGGNLEMIESGVSGWLVRDPSDLREALTEVQSQDRRLQTGRAALTRVAERYSPAAVYPVVAAAYAAAIEDARRGRHRS
jgi:glycogen(starch) synthase